MFECLCEKFDGGDCVPDLLACNVTNPNKVGNGICDYDAANYNTEECGWDGGDCIIEENKDCHTDFGDNPFEIIGDGICNEKYNIEACGYDEGDCCLKTVQNISKTLLGDGECHPEFNIPQCGCYTKITI